MLTRAQLSRLRSRTFGASRWLLAPQRRWLLFLAGGLAGFSAFLELGESLIEDADLLSLDERVLATLRGWRMPGLTIRAVDITAVGSSTLLGLIALCAGVSLLRLRDYRGTAQLICAMIGVAGWTLLTKTWFARARPDIAHRLLDVQGYSFPSGHSSGSATLFITLALIFAPHLRTWSSRVLLLTASCVLALLIGFTRMYLGVHYPSDVASGLSFGAGWSLLLAAVFEWRRRPSDSSADRTDLDG